MEETFKEEQEHLLYVQDEYSEIIEDTNLKIKNLPKFYKNNYEKMIDEKNRLVKRIDVLNNSKLKPYFARIDFQNTKDNIKDICYIGKIGVTNYDNKIIIVDWRAPIASLYYDSNIGNATYKAPEGKIDGVLLTKRQYEIENGKLISFNDVDTVSNDELLKPYLDVSADNRLKNIVSTIQSEQNQIIRQELKYNLIIQGVAGSGKTTVALHRIAYLVYNYRDIYKPNQYMVIGPNKFFVNYISSVLPELDVNDVAQYDLTDFAKRYLDFEFNVKNDLNSEIEKTEFPAYVTSMEFKKQIYEYLENYFDNIIPTEDLYFKNFKILNYQVIQKNYKSINDKIHRNLRVKIDKTITLLSREIDEKRDKILEKLLVKTLSKDEDNEKQKIEIKNRELLRKELNNSCNTLLKSYFKKLIKKPLQIYIEIINSNEHLRTHNYDTKFKVNDLKKTM